MSAKVKLGLAVSNPTFISKLRQNHTQMVLNADLLGNSPIPMNTYLNNISTFETAQSATLLGGKAAFAARDAAKVVCVGNYRAIGDYVNTVAQGNVEIIYLAGMEATVRGPRKYDFIDTPVDLRAVSLLTGTVKLRWKKVAHASYYFIQYCVGPITPDGWQDVISSKSASALITDLPSRTDCWFRVKAMGAFGVASNWSDPATVFVM